MFLTCSLQHVLHATTASTFATSQIPKVVRACCALYILTCSSRYNGVHFIDISIQKSSENDVFWHFWLPNVLRATTACNFSFLICPDVSAPAALASLLFDPTEPQNIGKHSVSRLSYPLARLHLLSSDFFPSDFLHVRVSSWLCVSIGSYCRKFSFQTSFDNMTWRKYEKKTIPPVLAGISTVWQLAPIGTGLVPKRIGERLAKVLFSMTFFKAAIAIPMRACNLPELNWHPKAETDLTTAVHCKTRTLQICNQNLALFWATPSP